MLSLPFLVFVVIGYAVVVLILGIDVHALALSLPMPSNVPLALSVGDLILFVGLFVMFIEVVKSTRTGTASVIDHVLSVALFVVCLLLLVLWAPFSTSTFLLITVMTLIDSIAGFAVTIASARRDFGVDPAVR